MISKQEIQVKVLIIIILTLLISCKKQITNEINIEDIQPGFSFDFKQRITKEFDEKGLYGDFLFAIIDENGMIYSYALNRDLLEGKETSLGNDAPIYIASHTKSFTATLLKILENKGQLDLTKPASHYLTELTYSDGIDPNNINIKSYLNHTHGILNNSFAWKTAFLGYSGSDSELISDLNKYSEYDSSHTFKYSNVGPIIAGMVVDKVAGHSWKNEMKAHIFQPLGMENTSTYVSDFDLGAIRPSVTASEKNGIIEKSFYKNDTLMHAAGGIISTVNDLSIWLSANIRQDNILLSKESWSELHEPTTTQDREYFTYDRTGYSLGWDIANYQGEKILTRFGGLAGISFHISFMPERKVGIIALSTDNRAYLLPHIMANYAYNSLSNKPADSIYEREKLKFDKSFGNENEIPYPDASQLLLKDAINDKILGTYQNIEGWPIILIGETEGYYTFKWGALKGKIYENGKNGYFSNLGILTRDFEVRNDSLFTGSLTYKKTGN